METQLLSGNQLDIGGHYFSQPWVNNFLHHCLGELKEIMQKLILLSERTQQWGQSGAVWTRVKT